jgi:hypothetical protein
MLWAMANPKAPAWPPVLASFSHNA